MHWRISFERRQKAIKVGNSREEYMKTRVRGSDVRLFAAEIHESWLLTTAVNWSIDKIKSREKWDSKSV